MTAPASTTKACSICRQPSDDIVHNKQNWHGYAWQICGECFARCSFCHKATGPDNPSFSLSFGTNGAPSRCCVACQARQAADEGGALCVLDEPSRINVESLKGA